MTKQKKDIIVYTVIVGDYDNLQNPLVVSKDCRYICFTDQKLTSDVWEMQDIPDVLKSLTQIKRQRILKILSHKYLPEHKWSVYVDANIQICVDVTTLIKDICNEAEISAVTHPIRDCIYDEELTVLSVKKDTTNNTKEQIKKYKNEGFPKHYGLNETGMLVRKNCDNVTRLEDLWSNEVLRGSHRDQLSFNYCLWKLHYSVNSLDKDIVRHSKHFNYFNHK